MISRKKNNNFLSIFYAHVANAEYLKREMLLYYLCIYKKKILMKITIAFNS